MSDNASPRPWRVERQTEVVDANGDFLFSCYGWLTKTKETETANAATVVAAVNDHDRLAADEARYRTHNVVLRDLVRRLANMAETTIPDAMENWGGFTSGRVEFEREAYALIREARAAIGEDSP